MPHHDALNLVGLQLDMHHRTDYTELHDVSPNKGMFIHTGNICLPCQPWLSGLFLEDAA